MISPRWLPRRIVVLVAVLGFAGALVSPASAAGQVTPGVSYRAFELTTSHGHVTGYVLTVDLRQARLDLLHPDVVAARDEIADMVNRQGAVAGVNGDFFNISGTHAGVAPTGAASGPEIASGRDRKGAVPAGQRFGFPGIPAEDVFAVGTDGRARLTRLDTEGVLRSTKGTWDVEGLNQYAVAVNGIGVFTSDWGTASRVRSTCGTDTNRSAPCSTETEEVVVRKGVVVAEHDVPLEGAIPEDTVVLVGREAGARELEALEPGDRVVLHTRLESPDFPPLTFAVGGFPILRNGATLSGVDASVLAPRTAAGVSADGRTVYLVVVDGRSATTVGMTLAELAELLRSFGADDGMNLDGGGSSTFVTRDPGETAATVKNIPSDGHPRPVANGVGVFPR